MRNLLNNVKASIYAGLIVVVVAIASIVYVPHALQMDVDQLQQSIQSKRILLQSLQKMPNKQTFQIPNDASEWLAKVPHDPQVEREIIQLEKLTNQNKILVNSINIQTSTDLNQNDKQQQNTQESNLTGKQKTVQHEDPMQIQKLGINLSLNGSFKDMSRLLYDLYQDQRIVHVDSLSIAADKETSSSTNSQNQVTVTNSSSDNASENTSVSSQKADANIQSKQNAANFLAALIQLMAQQSQTQSKSGNNNSVDGTANTGSSTTKVDGTKSNNDQLTLNQATMQEFINALQQIASGNVKINNSTLSNSQSNSILNEATGQSNNSNALFVSSPSMQADDEVSVNLGISLFYVPGADFLGDLPEPKTYDPSRREDPITP